MTTVSGLFDRWGTFGTGPSGPNYKKLQNRAAIQQIGGYAQMSPQEQAAAVAAMKERAAATGAVKPKQVMQTLQRTDAAGVPGAMPAPARARSGGGQGMGAAMQQALAARAAQRPPAPLPPPIPTYGVNVGTGGYANGGRIKNGCPKPNGKYR